MYVRPIALAACVLLFTACDFVPVPLPTANATLQSTQLDLPRGSYCWSSGGKAVCADAAGPDMLLETGYLRPYRTTGGFEISIAFQSESELRSFRVEVVKSPTGNAPVKTTGPRTFFLPGAQSVQPGIYVYMISSIWPQGDVSFFLPIDLASGAA
jgi:hypothetical protein